jgi:DNA replication protein DnaC
VIDLPPPPSEPYLVTCRCGREHPAVWYDAAARREAGRYVPPAWGAGRWVAPEIDPCPACRPTTTPFEGEVLARLRAAKVPGRYHGFTLRRADVLVQRPMEDAVAFQQRCSVASKFGAFKENLDALQGIRTWLGCTPDEWFAKPPRRWLVLHGPPGTGKTALLGAIARALLSVPPQVTVELPEKRLRHLHIHAPRSGESLEGFQWRVDAAVASGLTTAKRQGRVPQVLYLDGDELQRRVSQGFGSNRGDERDRIEEEARMAEVLLLDEVGARATVTDHAFNLFGGLLKLRHNDDRLTILATNRTWEELTGPSSLFGDAVADRLRSAQRVPLGGPSWRT